VTKQAVHSVQAPPPIGIYSQAIRAGGVIYVSGQIGLDPATMQLAAGFAAQAEQVCRNLAAIAAAAGTDLNAALKLTVFLTDMANFAQLNDILSRYFKQPYPSRSAVGVAQLPRGALVEIEAILAQDAGKPA